MTNKLCIDPGSTGLGAAIVPDGAKTAEDITCLSIKVGGSPEERVRAIARKIEILIENNEITQVFIEDITVVRQKSFEARLLLPCVTQHIAWACGGLPIEWVNITQARKAACEHAGVHLVKPDRYWSKKYGVMGFEALYGAAPINDNVADAGNIAYCVMKNPEAFRKKPKVKVRQRKLAV